LTIFRTRLDKKVFLTDTKRISIIGEKIDDPWELSPQEQKQLKILLGVKNYPHPNY
jgi:hypothetical protein